MNTIEMEVKSGDSGFEAVDENGHILHTDTSIENGGNNYGFNYYCLHWEVVAELMWYPF